MAGVGGYKRRVKHAVATAHSNIALAKYWGKQEVEHNRPAVPSLSMTLDAMFTTTSVTFDTQLEVDTIELGGNALSDGPQKRVVTLLDRVRQEAGIATRARVSSSNNFPTAAGLASSASGFAALALAAREAAGLPRDNEKVSVLARRSSASAARSIFGGYVALDAGESAARQVATAEHFPLELLVAVTQEGPKHTGSTEGMSHTRDTSPYYTAWIEHAPLLARQIEAAVLAADLEQLGPLVEQSALQMHASMWAAAPAIVYFSPATLSVMECVASLRRKGYLAYYTMDAGPHVKVITAPNDALAVRGALESVPGVLRTIHCKLGPDASVRVEAGP